MKKILLLFVILMAPMVWAEKVKGLVVDAVTGETLIGVTVVEKGTTRGVVSDVEGQFQIDVNSEQSELQISYVGFTTQTLVVGTKKDLGKILLQPETIGLEDVTVTGQIAVQHKTPAAVSQVNALEIEERLGSQEFVEVLKTTPGVHTTKQGGGWGDSELFMRGFTSENIGVLINGAPMNDMEWGGIYWSNWQGLGDVTSVMQTQRGMGASRVSSPTVGGALNIVTKGIDAKRGGTLSYGLGNDGYNKILFSVSTGLMRNGWAITVLGSRTWGNGYVQGTNFEGYTYFANISKRINESHQLSLTGFGAPQWHFQRAAKYGALTMSEWNKVKQYMTGGMHFSRYNPTYGVDQNGQHKSSDYNVYHKPQISLNHVWQINHKSSLSTSLYTSIGRGFGYNGEAGLNSGYSYSDWNGASYGTLNNTFRKADGTFDYGAITALNATSEYGSKLIMSEGRNFHNWVGLVSTYSNRFAEIFDFYGGIDFRYYKGTHTNVICDLYGGDYYIDPDRSNVKVENNAAAADDAWKYKKLGVGDVCYRDYDGYVVQEGAFSQLEYNKGHWSAFVNAAFNYTHYWRYDRFYYDAEHARSKTLGFPGGNIKMGFNYRIANHHNLFLNTGYVSRAPKYSYGAFMSATVSNAINQDAKNEQIASVELGYGFQNEYVNLAINGYFTEWMDKTMTKSGQLGTSQEDYYMNMTGVSARHMGVEFELKTRPTKWLEINAMLSLGDWTWDKDSVKGYAYDAMGQALTSNGTITTPGAEDHAYAYINMKGIKVGGAAQTTAALELNFHPFKGFKIGAGYTLYDRNYAYYSFSGSDLSLGKAINVVAPWRIPTSGQMDLRASYRFQIGKLDATLAGNVSNLLNQYYIEKAYNPQTTSTTPGAVVDESKVYFFFAQGRTWNLRLKLNF